MHAYLIYGGDKASRNIKSSEIAGSLKGFVYRFGCKKIEEVKEIKKVCRLSHSDPAVFILDDIQEASLPAANSLLKIIEEPPKNVYFILTATSLGKIVPTIVSRCKTIKIPGVKKDAGDLKSAKDFLELDDVEKIIFVSKIKKRGDAISFIENVINYLAESNYKSSNHGKVKVYESALKCLSAIEKNGNVNLQLLNFAISI